MPTSSLCRHDVTVLVCGWRGLQEFIGIIPPGSWLVLSVLPGGRARLLFRMHRLSGRAFMMAETKPSRPSVTGPVAQYADGFHAELARLGYTPLTTANPPPILCHLSR